MSLRLIQLGKPNQNAYIDSFNGRLRDVLEQTLVPDRPACPRGNRDHAPGIQRGATKERTERTDARSLRQSDGRDRLPSLWTQNGPATESGGMSMPNSLKRVGVLSGCSEIGLRGNCCKRWTGLEFATQ